MNTNVFIFHGTEGYPRENWFPWLKEELKDKKCTVFVPKFPSPPGEPASVAAWFDVLAEYKGRINQNTILVGHSLGGIFALRVLERQKSPVKAAFLVGTPVGISPILNFERDKSFSGFNFDWPNIKSKCEKFAVYQSDNDPYVSLGNGEEMAKQLGVNLTFIPNAGHFNSRAGYTSFERLLQDIQKIL